MAQTTFSSLKVLPQDAKLLIQAYDVFSQAEPAVEIFIGKNALGNTVSLHRDALFGLLTDYAATTGLPVEEVLQELRRLSLLADQEETTTALNQADLDALVSQHEAHLEELKKIDIESAKRAEDELSRIRKIVGQTKAGPSQPFTTSLGIAGLSEDQIKEVEARLSSSPAFRAVAQISSPETAPTQAEIDQARLDIQAALAHVPQVAPADIPGLAETLLTQAQTARKAAVPPPTPSTPITALPKPEAVTTQIVTDSLGQTLDQLPLSPSAKEEVKASLTTHDTVVKIVTQIHHPDHLVPGQTLTEVESQKAREQIYLQLEQALKGKLSPLALAALTDTVVAEALPVAKILSEFQKAQATGAVLIASEQTPIFPEEVTKIQEQIKQIWRTLPPGEAPKVISQTLDRFSLPEDKKDKVNLTDLKVQVVYGLHPDTLHALQAGLTPGGLSDAIQKGLLPESYRPLHDRVQNAQSATIAAGAAPAQMPLQPLSPINQIAVEGKDVLLTAQTTKERPSPFWLSWANRQHPAGKEAAKPLSPPNLVSVSKDSQPFQLFSHKAFAGINQRLASAQKLLTSTQGRFILRLQQSALGRLTARFTAFINQEVVGRAASWAGRQTIVIAARTAASWVGKQTVIIAAKAALVKTTTQAAAKAALGRLATKAAVTILTRLGVEAVAGATVAPIVGWAALLIDLGWQILKRIFSPKFWKSVFNWLMERPWILAAALLAPLFPILGLLGPVLFIAGAAGLAGIAITGGAAGLATAGGGIGLVFTGIVGFFATPIVFPLLVAILVFLGSWLFFTVFYLVFLIPQGFMSNLSSRQIALIATDNPQLFSLVKTASPRSITNEGLDPSNPPPVITYTLSLLPAKNASLSNLKVSEASQLFRKNLAPKDLQVYDWKTDPSRRIPSSISAGTVTNISYTLTLNNDFLAKNGLSRDDLKDSVIDNIVTVESDATDSQTNEVLRGLTQTAQAAVIIGKPDIPAPTGWPVWGNFGDGRACVTQGPNAPFTHRGTQAVDIALPAGQPVRATHPGTLSWGSDPYNGNYVLVTSNDKLYTTLYGHLDTRRQPGPVNYLEEVGKTTQNLRNGFMTGYHVHYQLKGSPLDGPEINKYLGSPAPIAAVGFNDCRSLPGKNEPAYPVRQQYIPK